MRTSARRRTHAGRHTHAARRAAALAGTAALLVVATALPASAHVTVSPTSAPQGSTQELVFKVPNEESTATTIEVQLQIPTQYPIAQVLARPVPGWTIAVHTVPLAKPLVTDDGSFDTAVDEIDWTGGSIPVNEYQDFAISVDPLPTATNQLTFKAVQTYSNGDVVRWIDLSVAGQPEPEHPAPVLTLTSASGADNASSSGSGSGSGTAAQAASASSGDGNSGGRATTALWLGALGLIAGVGALAVSLLNRRRSS